MQAPQRDEQTRTPMDQFGARVFSAAHTQPTHSKQAQYPAASTHPLGPAYCVSFGTTSAVRSPPGFHPQPVRKPRRYPPPPRCADRQPSRRYPSPPHCADSQPHVVPQMQPDPAPIDTLDGSTQLDATEEVEGEAAPQRSNLELEGEELQLGLAALTDELDVLTAKSETMQIAEGDLSHLKSLFGSLKHQFEPRGDDDVEFWMMIQDAGGPSSWREFETEFEHCIAELCLGQESDAAPVDEVANQLEREAVKDASELEEPMEGIHICAETAPQGETTTEDAQQKGRAEPWCLELQDSDRGHCEGLDGPRASLRNFFYERLMDPHAMATEHVPLVARVMGSGAAVEEGSPHIGKRAVERQVLGKLAPARARVGQARQMLQPKVGCGDQLNSSSPNSYSGRGSPWDKGSKPASASANESVHPNYDSSSAALEDNSANTAALAVVGASEAPAAVTGAQQMDAQARKLMAERASRAAEVAEEDAKAALLIAGALDNPAAVAQAQQAVEEAEANKQEVKREAARQRDAEEAKLEANAALVKAKFQSALAAAFGSGDTAKMVELILQFWEDTTDSAQHNASQIGLVLHKSVLEEFSLWFSSRWDRFDHDNDGIVDPEELQAALELYIEQCHRPVGVTKRVNETRDNLSTREPSAADVSELEVLQQLAEPDRIDSNNHHKTELDHTESCRIHQLLEIAPAKVLTDQTSRGDGGLGAMAPIENAKQCREDLERMESNKDGLLDEKEFAVAGGSKEEFDVNGGGVLKKAGELARLSAAQAQALTRWVNYWIDLRALQGAELAMVNWMVSTVHHLRLTLPP